jgi:hypothetical protein
MCGQYGTEQDVRSFGASSGLRGVEGGNLMSAAERYRRYAADCLRLANAARAQAEKVMLVEMADRWVRLAEQVERGETPTSEK